MKRSGHLLIALMTVLPLCAVAQQTSSPMIYATYYECDVGSEALADQLVQSNIAPLFDRLVSSGDLTTWGWLSHNTGGTWRRAVYFIAPDGDGVLDARNTILEEIQSKLPVQGRELNRICPKHEDYIWRNVAGSDAPSEFAQERRTAGMSTYFECDWSREDRVDEIMETTFVPVLNDLTADGSIGAWSWNAHVVGGPYRRLLVYDGTDHKALLQATARLSNTLASQHPAEAQEFNQICHRHQDYMWDITAPQQ